MLEGVLLGFQSILQPAPVLAMVLGTILGIMLGAIPGLTATLGIALAIPFTFGLSPFVALGLLAGIHNGGSQGSSIPSILLRIPGTPGSIVTTWDGYPLARKGHAAGAINLAAVSSAVGGVLSALALILIAPPLAAISLSFGPPELFWVNVFGLSVVAALIGDDAIKGIISVCLGLLISSVGIDPISGVQRYTFGITEIVGGFSVIAVMLGVFCLPPIWDLARASYRTGSSDLLIKVERTGKRIWKFSQVWGVWLRSSIIGIIIGILPGSAISSFIAYNEAKRASKTPEEFGKGSVEGLAAAESVNNADNAAAMIPTLTLGIPGSSIAALMLGALLIHGFQPGPRLFTDAPAIVYGYAAAMFITALLLIPLGGALAARVFAHVLRIPAALMLPLVMVIAVTGSYASENSLFQVYTVTVFGLIGFVMDRFRFPLAPLVIAVVLGSKAEFNLRISLLMSAGDTAILYTRPISMVLMALTAFMVLFPVIRAFRDHRRAKVPAEGGLSEPSKGET